MPILVVHHLCRSLHPNATTVIYSKGYMPYESLLKGCMPSSLLKVISSYYTTIKLLYYQTALAPSVSMCHNLS